MYLLNENNECKQTKVIYYAEKEEVENNKYISAEGKIVFIKTV